MSQRKVGSKNKLFKIINYFILIFTISNCNSSFIRKEVKNEEKLPLIEDAIFIKISGQAEPLKVKLKLKPSLPDKADYPKLETFPISAEGETFDGIIKLDVPAGKYYGILEINNTKYYPLLFTDMSRMNIFFGFYPGEHTFLNLSQREIYENKVKSCENSEKSALIKTPLITMNCGALTIDESNKVFLEFKIEEENSFSAEGTFFIWVAAAYVSATTNSPFGLIVPAVMGTFAMERKIEHNLK